MQPRTHPSIASQHYRMLELKSRIESSSAHGLVGLLYEELLRALDLARASAEKGKTMPRCAHITKALSIIVALEGSLDMDKGGDLALTLARIYRACSQGLNDVSKNGDLQKLGEIRESVSTIAYAWQTLSKD